MLGSRPGPQRWEAAPREPGLGPGKSLHHTEPAFLLAKWDTDTSQTDDGGWTGTFHSLE